ncbi:hypothetical protein AAFF_G00261030 [Aldrovandia affinis]|uniref:Uncharacterized protein n=1 Tax=Aldrovandia affinis TaxID=143900 RepID=A0AAD7W234_9TELE|nr:hypothetical protein AAFF_G00261030 [Aldrovandia affinis]
MATTLHKPQAHFSLPFLSDTMLSKDPAVRTRKQEANGTIRHTVSDSACGDFGELLLRICCEGRPRNYWRRTVKSVTGRGKNTAGFLQWFIAYGVSALSQSLIRSS